MNKKFNIKFYDKDVNFLKNLSGDILESDVSFTQNINGGQGEFMLDLAIPFDSAPDYIVEFNFVRVYAIDQENPLGRLIYTGWISQTEPFTTGSRSGIRVVCLGLVSLLSLSLYKDGANFDVVQSGVDPGEIIEDIISEYQSTYPPATGTEWIGDDAVAGIREGGNIDTVGTNIDFTFQKRKWKDAIEDTLELSDAGWYWFIDKGGDVFFKEKSSTADHTFTIGKDIQSLNAPKNIEDVVNDVTVAYDGGTVNSTDATSISDFGKRERYIDRASDTNDATTAQQIADKEVSDKKNERFEISMVVNDLYDIESIRPGQTCKILNYRKDSGIFSENMLIVQTRYRNGDTLELQMESKRDVATELIKLIDEQAQ